MINLKYFVYPKKKKKKSSKNDKKINVNKMHEPIIDYFSNSV